MATLGRKATSEDYKRLAKAEKSGDVYTTPLNFNYFEADTAGQSEAWGEGKFQQRKGDEYFNSPQFEIDMAKVAGTVPKTNTQFTPVKQNTPSFTMDELFGSVKTRDEMQTPTNSKSQQVKITPVSLGKPTTITESYDAYDKMQSINDTNAHFDEVRNNSVSKNLVTERDADGNITNRTNEYTNLGSPQSILDYRGWSEADLAVLSELDALQKLYNFSDEDARALESANYYLTNFPDLDEEQRNELLARKNALETIKNMSNEVGQLVGAIDTERKQQEYLGYLTAPDFVEMAAQGEQTLNSLPEGYEELLRIQYGDSSDPVISQELQDEAVRSAQENTFSRSYLSDEEKQIMYYLEGAYGREAVEEYLDFLEQTINQRKGEEITENWDAPVLRQLYNLYGGAANSVQGIKQLFSDEALPVPAEVIAAQELQNRTETGVGKLSSQLAFTTGNMAPSIAASLLTSNPALGTAIMSSSAGGNAYGQALRDGYTQEEATGLGLLTAVTEGTMQYVLGGIPQLGGAGTQALSNKISNAASRVIKNDVVRNGLTQIVTGAGGEFAEEYLQSILEPVIRNIALGEDNEFELISEDALYEGLLGALSGGLFSAGNVIAQGVSANPASTDLPTDINVEQISPEQSKAAFDAELLRQITSPETSQSGLSSEMYNFMRQADGIATPQNALTETSYAALDEVSPTITSVPTSENTPTGQYTFPAIRRSSGDGDMRVSQTANTLMQSTMLNAEQSQAIANEIDNEMWSYQVATDEGAANYADSLLRTQGMEGALSAYESVRNERTYSPTMTDQERSNTFQKSIKGMTRNEQALALRIAQEAFGAGDTELGMRLMSDVAVETHNAAQLMRAARDIVEASPEGSLYLLQSTADKLTNDLKLSMGSKAPDIQVDQQLAQDYYDAQVNGASEADIESARQSVIKNIADQIPTTMLEKVNQWRYFSMLANPRTHIRNIVGNTGMRGLTSVKNAIATPIEMAAEKIFGSEKIDRTKAFLSRNDRQTLIPFAQEQFNKSQAFALGESKYSTNRNYSNEIMEARDIFKSPALKWMNPLIKGNNYLLNIEDIKAQKPTYVNSMAQYMKANDLTVEYLQSGTRQANVDLQKARQYALAEAQRATFRDVNEIANAISNFEDKNAATRLLIGGTLPFKSTPMNIVKRGIEYSPIGLARGVKNAFVDVKNGKVTASQAIDRIASGLTGSGVMLLGSYLANLGLVTGSGNDKEPDELAYLKAQGWQPYSVKIGDTYYSLDWAAPTAMPFFVGVEWANMDDSNEDIVGKAVSSMSTIMGPVTDMSVLQSLDNMFRAIKYEDDPLLAVVGNSAKSVAQQFIPSVSGALARSIDPVRRDSYNAEGSGATKDLNVMLNQMQAKIPGLSQNVEPYINIWGQEEVNDNTGLRIAENFLSPGYFSKENITPVDNYINSLYESTGESGVIPSRSTYGSNTLKKDGEGFKLSPEELTQYATVRGETAFSIIDELRQNEDFTSLSEYEQAEIIKSAYSLATSAAKSAVGADLGDAWTGEKAIALNESGVSFADQLLYRETAGSSKTSSNGEESYSISKNEALSAISSTPNLTEDQKWQLFAETSKSFNADKLRSTNVDFDTISKFITTADKDGKPGISKDEAFSYLYPTGGLSNEKKWALMEAVVSNYKSEKYRNAGLPYDTVAYVYMNADTNNNGSISQSELRDSGISTEDMVRWWEMNGWKGKP